MSAVYLHLEWFAGIRYYLRGSLSCEEKFDRNWECWREPVRMKDQETSLLPVCPGLVSFLVFHSVLFCFSPSLHKYQSDPVAISKGQQQSSVHNGRSFCALREFSPPSPFRVRSLEWPYCDPCNPWVGLGWYLQCVSLCFFDSLVCRHPFITRWGVTTCASSRSFYPE